MRYILPDSLADFEFRLNWDSRGAAHTDIFFAHKANLWRDCFPGRMHEHLIAKAPGESVTAACRTDDFGAGEDPRRRVAIKRSQFRGGDGVPRAGRFYPQGLLSGVAGVFPGNARPFRCTGVGPQDMAVDLNHPLAGRSLTFEARVRDVHPKPHERGGSLTHWLEAVADGPGMQVRYNGAPTAFLEDDALARGDEGPDAEFYRRPRMVQHLDARAVEEIGRLYGGLFHDGDVLLDLMSSWTSHLPANLAPASVAGLGLNSQELEANPLLTQRVVQDLNLHPQLPFDDGAFDGVMCTASVEYLTRPAAVFQEVARVLRPGGRFVVSFSNRWFPTKAIRIWQKLHDFERLGLVLEYFMQSGAFTGLQTLSLRGLPRPADDKYYPAMIWSDPVFAVWGETLPPDRGAVEG